MRKLVKKIYAQVDDTDYENTKMVVDMDHDDDNHPNVNNT